MVALMLDVAVGADEDDDDDDVATAERGPRRPRSVGGRLCAFRDRVFVTDSNLSPAASVGLGSDTPSSIESLLPLIAEAAAAPTPSS